MDITALQTPRIRPELPFKLAKVKLVARAMLRRCGLEKAVLSIVFIDGKGMRRLNREHLGHDFVTDVVTFDLKGHKAQGTRHRSHRQQSVPLVPCVLCPVPDLCIDGEIYICPAEAKRNARAHGEPFERELLRYLAHGILHLLGHDDTTEIQRMRMRKLEDKLLTLAAQQEKGEKAKRQKGEKAKRRKYNY